MRLGRRLSTGIAEDPQRVEEPRPTSVVETPAEPRSRAEDVRPEPVAAAADR